jgi:ABC-type Fe3+ transport system substrate-binding protein
MTEEWKSPDWMRQFVPQVDAINRDDRMISEWVARGKYAMAIADRNTYLSFKEAGLPIDLIAPAKSPGVMSGGPSVSLINKAPHANAAKVFIKCYLSKEGQTVYSKAVGEPSVRLDVPTGHLDPRTLPEPGKTYFNQSTEKWLKGVMAKQAQRTALAKEIFAPLLEKR